MNKQDQTVSIPVRPGGSPDRRSEIHRILREVSQSQSGRGVVLTIPGGVVHPRGGVSIPVRPGGSPDLRCGCG